MKSCSHCNHKDHYCIDNVPIFRDLLPDEKESIMNSSNQKNFKKGEIIFTPGDSFDDLFVVNKGMVKISKVSSLGKEQILRILKPGDFMGELTLFSKSILSNTAEALEQTEICIIQGNRIRQLLIQSPEIAIKFLQKYTERIEETEELIEQIGLRDVEQRIANYLLIEIENNRIINNNGKYEVALPVSKGDLAALIGTTQETLSRKLSLFQDNGWIKLKGQRIIEVADIKRLESIR
ncbi:Crp/Fnr family transcriptional regulator [Sedimentibacter hydroxybenzoicus DSM 7310]|uniref:Crp/Fnr family transcriptional regulator n=1 Tax=Sedimentibacter hydroxybenzoicus DSM 7310 TaxID=1123245 RepID=A0A974GX54_SEDHY|nr:Crp/Fnr family transcriptional regulator [Sedimentibacter hydroxybenzoicus]NYB74725.1 Crp/Fnr family transcriptional regulator [Sedimentibacter hydroxybenzoicus DSM 7310]